MINKLFGSIGAARLDDERPEMRLRALARLDAASSDGMAQLRQLAASDPDSGVREAALAAIDDAAALLALMEERLCQVAAARRLGQLIDAGLDAAALAESSGNPATARLLLDAVTQPEHWQALLARLDDEEVLGEIAARHGLAPVRMAAVQRLQDETVMRRVEKQARGKDKAVLQHVRDALEARRAVRQGMEEVAQRTATLADELAVLARSADDPQRAERVAWIGQQLDVLGSQRAELETRAATLQVSLAPPGSALQAAADLHQQLTADMQAALAEAQRQQAEAREHRMLQDRARGLAASLDARIDASITALGARSTDNADPAGASAGDVTPDAAGDPVTGLAAELESALTELTTAFDALGVDDATLRRSFEQRLQAGQTLVAACQRLQRFSSAGQTPPQAAAKRQRWCQQRLQELAWPSDLPTPPALQRLRDLEAAASAELQATETERNATLERVEALCGNIDSALDDGHLKDAIAHAAQARKLLDGVAGGAGSAAFNRLARASARIEELGDWQKFATQPKRAELCEQMQALVGAALEPEALAERIKALRETWNALGPARDAAGRALVDRFNAAATQAFEPCKLHFEQQRQQRQFNLQNREQICAELERFEQDYTWNTPDWKAVERIVREASQQWHQYADVDPGANRRVGRRYHEVVTRLRERLDARRAENLARREALVARARELAASDDRDAAANEAKGLQRQWQDADIMPRGADRRLWKAFRAACDGIFSGLQAQRQAERSASDAAIEALEQRGRDLAVRVRPLADAGLRQQQLPDDVQADLGALERDLTELRRETSIPSQRAEALSSLIRELRDVLRSIKQQAPWRDALLAAETALQQPPQGSQQASAATDADRAALALREAGVDMELLAGVDSPETEQALRMERQVKRLAAGMRGELNAAGAEDQALADILARLQQHAAGAPADVTSAVYARAQQAIAGLLGG